MSGPGAQGGQGGQVGQGLRDVKREATARALAQAAFDLAVERGLDGFTTDDIVSRAGYSRRTFANHYSCKEEAVVAVVLESVRDGIETPADVPDDAPLLDWLHALARRQLSGPMLPTIRRLQALAHEHPTLEPYVLEAHRRIRLVALEVVSARAGAEHPALYVHLLVGAVYGALAAVLEGPFTIRTPDEPRTPGSLSVDTFLKTTFTHLRTGF